VITITEVITLQGYKKTLAENECTKSPGLVCCNSSRRDAKEAGNSSLCKGRGMTIEELLERVVAQNETIIRQNVELLLNLSVLVEKHSSGKSELEIGTRASSGEAA
jgi:hypothetical protein